MFDESWTFPGGAKLFHGLNQRMPSRRARRTVCTFHDLFVLTEDYSTVDFRQRFAQQAREAASASDLIITVSDFTASQVCNLLGVERARVRVIHHGIRRFEVADRPPPEQSERLPIVLHVGAVQRRKNIVRLVGAFESLPATWHLVLAGSGSGYGASEAMEAIERSPARDRITVTGYVSQHELADLYARASIFAFPSLDEGFGMPILEAMSRGVPVITSNRSSLPEVAGDAALFVDPTSVECIAQALRNMADDSSVRAEYTGRGLKRAEMFSWNSAVRKTWEVYLELGIRGTE